MAALGFTHPTPPCAATLHRVLRRLDQAQVEAALGGWAEEVLATMPPATKRAGAGQRERDSGGGTAGAGQREQEQEQEREGVSVDGKCLRGSRKQGAPGTHLLSAVSQRLGLTLAQEAVDD